MKYKDRLDSYHRERCESDDESALSSAKTLVLLSGRPDNDQITKL